MSIDTLVLVCLVLLGLAVGSFLNVCIHRLPSRSSVVSPGSRCPSCGYALGWADNIPVVSYVMLRGRCRSCKASISLRYPIVELLTMGVFVLNFAVFGADPILVIAFAPRPVRAARQIQFDTDSNFVHVCNCESFALCDPPHRSRITDLHARSRQRPAEKTEEAERLLAQAVA